MSLSAFCLINAKMDNTQNKYLKNGIEILDVYNMMDPDYEREQDKCGVRKSHMVEIIVKSFVGYGDVKGRGELLLKIREKGFCSEHGFLKRIYESLPEYRGKRLWIQIHNLTNGQMRLCSGHLFRKNKIPFKI